MTTKLFERVKDYMIVASHVDGKTTELNLIKDLTNEIERLEQVNKTKPLPSGSHCACPPDKTTGTTSVQCCNICGKPAEDFWIVAEQFEPISSVSVSVAEVRQVFADSYRKEQLQALEDLKEFARNNCREWNTDQMEEIIDRL